MTALIGSQFFGIVWSASQRSTDVSIGASPLDGTHEIHEVDDNPYTDRAIACMLAKRRYSSVPVNQAVNSSSAHLADSSMNGFRLVARDGLIATDKARESYTRMCNTLAANIDSVFATCAVLGYNVTRDALRVVVGLDASDVVVLQDSLPVVILPIVDNAEYARIAIPGMDGAACVFRVEGLSLAASTAPRYFIAVDRDVREQKTIERLHQSGGAWRHGWYEDSTGGKWFSDMVSSERSRLNITQRQFDFATGAEYDCNTSEGCVPITYSEEWGPSITMNVTWNMFTFVTITNGNDFGVLYRNIQSVTRVSSDYDLATFISDISIIAVLMRWGACLAALHLGYRRGLTLTLHHAGIGCLSCSRTFNFVPLLLLPRLKMILTAFGAVGCNFTGEQSALTEAWFVIYPAVAELLVFYFCLLNWVGIVFRRRMTDALFGPTLISLCLMHYYRQANTRWLGCYDSLNPTMSSSDFESLRLVDFFDPSTVLRLNGNIRALVALKLALLAANALLMLIPSQFTSFQSRSRATNVVCEAEQVLAFQASILGGIGISSFYEIDVSQQDTKSAVLSSYEVVRIGYIIVGDKYLVGISDWYKLLFLSPTRFLHYPSNIRVTLFVVKRATTNGKGEECAVIKGGPIIMRVNDLRLRSVHLNEISISPFQ